MVPFVLRIKRFDPSQPRDPDGKWTSTGAGDEGGGKDTGGTAPAAAAAKDAQDNTFDLSNKWAQDWDAIAEAAREKVLAENPRLQGAKAKIKDTISSIMAEAKDETEWRDWYDRHKDTATKLFGNKEPVFESFLAAASIDTMPAKAVPDAINAMLHYLRGGDFNEKDYPPANSDIGKPLPAVMAEFDKIANGKPLTGKKTVPFEKALQGDWSQVVTDRHMIRLLFKGASNKKYVNKSQVAVTHAVVTEIADRLGWKPAELQAVLWVVSLNHQDLAASDFRQYLDARADDVAKQLKTFTPKRADDGEMEDPDLCPWQEINAYDNTATLVAAFEELDLEDGDEADFEGRAFDPSQPRDPDTGKWVDTGASKEGGGAASAKAAASAAEAKPPKEGKGFEFVSPNLSSDLPLWSAIREAQGGQRQIIFGRACEDVDKQLGLKNQLIPAIGAWKDGAENSFVTITSNADWDKLTLSAAMKGWLGLQKSVLVFQQQKGGDAVLASFTVPFPKDFEDFHKKLLEDGLPFHTLAATEGRLKGKATVKLTVYVAVTEHDQVENQIAALKKAAGRYDAKITHTAGRAEFIGDSSGTGSDADQRDASRKVFEARIERSTVRGAGDVWQRIRDRWGEELALHDAVFYHGTASDLIESIQANGLIPAKHQRDKIGRTAEGADTWARQNGLGVGTADIGREASVYITPKADLAAEFANTTVKLHPNAHPVVIRAVIPAKELPNVIADDKFAVSGNSVVGYRFKGTIKADWINQIYAVSGAGGALAVRDKKKGEVIIHAAPDEDVALSFIVIAMPPISETAKDAEALQALVDKNAAREFDPNQPRDPDGKWASGGGGDEGGGSVSLSKGPSDVEQSAKGKTFDEWTNAVGRPFDKAGNNFIAAYMDETPPSVGGVSDYSSGLTWMQQGDAATLTEQGKEAVLRLGDNEREYIAFLATSGKEFGATNGTRVGFIRGEQYHCTITPNIEKFLREPRQYGNKNEATYEIHHNHPLPYTVSIGDIASLNAYSRMIAIHAHDVDGASSSASIVGRDKTGAQNKWYDFRARVEKYSDQVDKLTKDPVRKVRNEIADKANGVEATQAASFMVQHSYMLGLAEAGLIEYKYTLSGRQQAWLTAHAEEFDEIVAVAKQQARNVEKIKA